MKKTLIALLIVFAINWILLVLMHPHGESDPAGENYWQFLAVHAVVIQPVFILLFVASMIFSITKKGPMRVWFVLFSVFVLASYLANAAYYAKEGLGGFLELLL